MAKSKKNDKTSAKPSVKVEDLEPEKDPKGGAVDMFLKHKADHKFNTVNKVTPGLKDNNTLAITDSSLKLHK